jgi:hypothetical protein
MFMIYVDNRYLIFQYFTGPISFLYKGGYYFLYNITFYKDTGIVKLITSSVLVICAYLCIYQTFGGATFNTHITISKRHTIG